MTLNEINSTPAGYRFTHPGNITFLIAGSYVDKMPSGQAGVLFDNITELKKHKRGVAHDKEQDSDCG